jgi:hypothetical protein
MGSALQCTSNDVSRIGMPRSFARSREVKQYVTVWFQLRIARLPLEETYLYWQYQRHRNKVLLFFIPRS